MTAARGERFYSEAWGEQQPLPNGNVLITESYARSRVRGDPRGPAQDRLVLGQSHRRGRTASRAVASSARRVRFAPGELPFVESRAIAGKTPAGQQPSVQTLATPPAPG